MKIITKLVIAAAALLAVAALGGCNTAIALTDGGRLVLNATDADLPGGCTLIGDVAIGHPPDAARPRTTDDLVLLMRNKAAELGGNYVVVDSQEERGEAEKHWVGRARAYRCPTEVVNAAGQGGAAGTSGDSDFGRVGPGDPEDEGDADGEGGEGSEDAADGDAPADDLDI